MSNVTPLRRNAPNRGIATQIPLPLPPDPFDSDIRQRAQHSFEPVSIAADQLACKDEFGSQMTNVRYAASMLGMTKTELIDFARYMGAHKGEVSTDAHMLATMHRRLSESAALLSQYAEYCEVAAARLLVAGCAIEISVSSPKGQ
jgi:hypothetical protein